ncbi:MAG: DUF3570 domain-containing protein [Proteobacteria bacterium]|nr:DUF3570 domain-containing protein [Pseudomonadota bacterium]
MRSALHALAAAAAALPLVSLPVRAGQIEEAKTGLNLFSYQERDGRIGVLSPTAWVQAPVARDLDFEARVTFDSVAGASPQYVSNEGGPVVHTLSSASIREWRKEGMFKATRWLGDDSLSLGADVSSEHDYLSQTLSTDAKFEFLNKNVTWAIGASVTGDAISFTGFPDIHQRRVTRGVFTGITQILSPTDILQSNLAFTNGRGYFDDHYEYTVSFLGRRVFLDRDRRPDARHSLSWLTRWKHYVPALGAALGLDYRYYQDSWGIRSHMSELSWHQPLSTTWSARPVVRYYTQSAASFYSTTVASSSGVSSSDTRLAAFGTLTLAFNLSARLGDRDTFEIGAGRYVQRSSWRFGSGSPDLPRFDASYAMLGWTRTF